MSNSKKKAVFIWSFSGYIVLGQCSRSTFNAFCMSSAIYLYIFFYKCDTNKNRRQLLQIKTGDNYFHSLDLYFQL